MSKRRNTFSRALRQLKSEEIDKKIQLSETMPTNNTMGVFISMPPGGVVSTTTVSREFATIADLDFDVDGESDGTDTTGLFETDGTIKASMPPGDISYILGPMSAMYYGWWNSSGGGTTTVGYIRQADRKMVNLGTISGKLHEWDGASFNSYGQLTLEQAQWFKDVKKKDDAGNDPANANYRAFYPGPPSNSPDAQGRYLCTVTGQPKDSTSTQNVEVPHSPTEKGEMSADDNFAALMDKLKRGEELSDKEKEFLKNKNKEDEKEAENMLDKLKDHWRASWEDVKNFPKDVKDFGKDLLNALDEFTDRLPALEYSKDIAQSVLDNEPKDNSHTITQDDKDKLYDGLNYDNVKINDTKEPYADDNIIEDENGNVRPRNQWPTNENGEEILNYNNMTQEQKDQANAWFKDHNDHPSNTTPVQNEQSEKEMNASAGASNPLAAAGQAQTQVYKNEKGEWMFSYHDHAYHNVDSKDPGEVPGIGFINPKLWISNAVHAVSDAVHGRPKESQTWTSNAENTGGMEGYPSNIRGDSIRSFETKLEDMPQEFQNYVKNKTKGNTHTNSYIPRGRVISEAKASRVLKNLKKPIVLPEGKRKTYKVKPGARMRGMDKLVGDIKPQQSYKEPQKIWSKNSQGYNERSSQEKKNQVLQYVGASMDHWDYMTDTVKKQGGKIMANYKDHDYLYNYWLGGTRKKAVRKEEVKGDYVVFLNDGTSILQSSYNEKVEKEKEKEMFDEYYKLNPKKEPIPYENDPLFKKVSKRLKTVIDYPEKPAKKGYPNEPPPKMVNGWHPEYGKRYKYDKLDPVSAKAMPPTGNPEIDANVEKTKAKPK